MDDTDEIVEYKRYESAIDANLAKTKLDAYGIPCFLADENLANLYPIQNLRFSVRLHVFAKDLHYVHEVLNEQVEISEEDKVHCPRCQSAKVEVDYTKKYSWRFLTLFLSFFFAIFPLKKTNQCQDCGLEF